jgi:hypothetical protein
MEFRVNNFYFKLVFTIRTWFIHPVAMVDYFKIIEKKKCWAESPFALLLGKVESNNDYSAYNQTKIKGFF